MKEMELCKTLKRDVKPCLATYESNTPTKSRNNIFHISYDVNKKVKKHNKVNVVNKQVMK